MFLTLIRQELLTHLMSARFFAAVIITLLLVVANTFVLIGAHEERLADYSQKEAVNRETVAATPAYSVLKLKVQRPPNPLSLFSAGLETRFGSDIDIAFDSVPALSNPIADVRPEEKQWTLGSVPSLSSPGTPLGLNNPYLHLFSQIDIVFTFQVVLSLLSLLFAYDAIAGDWETGTLRLVLSHSVGRGSVLLAKYIAAMVCLFLPVLMSLLLTLIQCSFARSLQFNTDDFLRIGGIVLTTVVYLSVFYLIGLLISTTTRRAATSLMLCMFLWVVLVLVYPNWSRFALNPVGDMRAEKLSTNQQVAQIREEADRERDRFLANSPLKGDPPLFFDTFAGTDFFKGGGWYLGDLPRVNIQIELKNTTDTLVTHLRRYYEFAATLQIQNAEKVYLIAEQLVAQISHRQAQWDERLMKLSPASLYTFATAAWAGTDLDSMIDYIRAAQTYRRTLIDAFHERDAFASLQWFSTNQGTVDWSILPDFRFEQADVSINAQRALPELLLLVFINLVLFTSTFLIFIKIEV
ncbi:ABC transporter permease subunit [Candidatus Poribacteria bacterium]|nr:ABC transporter permease subunit [Candidatus Poribacteria bacterium]